MYALFNNNNKIKVKKIKHTLAKTHFGHISSLSIQRRKHNHIHTFLPEVVLDSSNNLMYVFLTVGENPRIDKEKKPTLSESRFKSKIVFL